MSLNFTGITDAGLAHISGLTSIASLSLSLYHNPISDAGLGELAKLTRCQGSLILETEVTPNGVASLQKKLPSMIIGP